ncbi:MAG: GAF domain-containing sensor histidine kinase [Chloroflexota bacterium]
MTEFSSLGAWLPIIVVSVVSLLIGAAATLLLFRPGKKRRPPPKKKPSTQRRNTQPRTAQQSERLDSESLHKLYELITTLTATLNYQRVIDIALDLSTQALATPDDSTGRLVSTVLLFSKSNAKELGLYVGTARRFTRSDLRCTFPAQKGLLKNAIDEGAPLLIQDISQDPELGRVLAFRSCNSAYCFPLQQGLDTYGVLLFAHPESKYFTTVRREVLDIIGNQAVVAIQNACLYQELEQEKERMMEIQEEARKKLARDLHDGPTQSVAAIAMRVNFARRLIDRDTNAASEELLKIEDVARRTTKEIRHMLFTLRPLVLESQGLKIALESMANKMRETYGQNVLVDIDQDIVDELEMGKQGVIFFIVEEAVNNARKHAEADHIWVRLKTIQQDIAMLEIQDDGAGFDVGAVDATYEHRGSLGMVNMRERSELVNGILNIKSAEGEGTHIQVVIPLNEDASDRLRRGI